MVKKRSNSKRKNQNSVPEEPKSKKHKSISTSNSIENFANLCVICGDDMGEMNPRQLCGKTTCLNENILVKPRRVKKRRVYDKDDESDDEIFNNKIVSSHSNDESEYSPIKRNRSNISKMIRSESGFDIEYSDTEDESDDEYHPDFYKETGKVDQKTFCDNLKEKSSLTSEQVEELNRIIQHVDMNKPTLNKILDSDASIEHKMHMFDNYMILNNVVTDEFIEQRNKLNRKLNGDPFIERVKKLDVSKFTDLTKNVIRKEIMHLSEMQKTDSEEYFKLLRWVDLGLDFPTECKKLSLSPTSSVKKNREFMLDFRKRIDSYLYGLDNVKEKLIDKVFNIASNPLSRNHVIAVSGPPGVGKSSIARCVSESLELPLITIKLGGCTSAEKIKGSNKVFVGGDAGEVLKGVVNCGVLNPVIWIDEIDKAGGNFGGTNTIHDALNELLDPEFNSRWTEDYLGYEINMSHAIYIVTANNPSLLPEYLQSRLKFIEIPEYSFTDKVNILCEHTLVNICNRMKFKVNISKQVMKFMLTYINDHTKGMRLSQNSLEEMLEKLHRRYKTGGKVCNKVVKNGINVTNDHIKELLTSPINKDSPAFMMYL